MGEKIVEILLPYEMKIITFTPLEVINKDLGLRCIFVTIKVCEIEFSKDG